MKSLFRNGKLLAILAGIVAIGAVVTSVCLNPPSEIRARNLDQERLQGLKGTENGINHYFNVHHALPDDLNALDNERNWTAPVDWHDPETKIPFEYRILDATDYQLCITFSRSSGKEDNSYNYSFRKHSAGRDCFQQSVSQNGQQ